MKMKRQEEENEQQESQADKPQTTALIPQVGREHEAETNERVPCCQGRISAFTLCPARQRLPLAAIGEFTAKR
jgi:hypothetical protein